MTANPVELIGGMTTTADVPKPDFVSWAKAHVSQGLADVTAVNNTDLAGQLLIQLKSTGRVYALDTSDATTADDGVDCIISNDGYRFKICTVTGGDDGSFSAHKNGTNQTGIVTATSTKITFPTAEFNVDGYYDASTSRFTPTAGYWIMTAVVTFSAIADASQANITIYKNGAAYRREVSHSSVAGSKSVRITAIVYASGSDYFEIWAQGNGSGGNKTVVGTAPDTFFAAARIGGATGPAGPAGVDGASSLGIRVRLVDTAGATPSTAYVAGGTVDGLTLIANDVVLRATAGGAAADGPYIVQASGAPVRHTSYLTYDSLVGVLFAVEQGTNKGLWQCVSDPGGTLGANPLDIQIFSAGGGAVNCTMSGTGNAIVLTPATAVAAWTDGLRIRFVPTASAGSGTIGVTLGALAAKTLRGSDGIQYSTLYDIRKDIPIELEYVSSLDCLIIPETETFNETCRMPSVQIGSYGYGGVTFGPFNGGKCQVWNPVKSTYVLADVMGGLNQLMFNDSARLEGIANQSLAPNTLYYFTYNLFGTEERIAEINFTTVAPAINNYGLHGCTDTNGNLGTLIGMVYTLATAENGGVQAVSGAVNNGSGLIRLTIGSTAYLVTGQRVTVASVGGVTAANGSFKVTVIDGTHIDLQGSTFSGTYTSGGTTTCGQTAFNGQGAAPQSVICGWVNPQRLQVQSTYGGYGGFTSTSYAEVNANQRITFVAFATMMYSARCSGFVSNNTSGESCRMALRVTDLVAATSQDGSPGKCTSVSDNAEGQIVSEHGVAFPTGVFRASPFILVSAGVGSYTGLTTVDLWA